MNASQSCMTTMGFKDDLYYCTFLAVKCKNEFLNINFDLCWNSKKVVNSIEEQNGSEKIEELFDHSETRPTSPPPRSPLDNTRRPRSPSPQRERYL